jgi:site-specific DNA recombinase
MHSDALDEAPEFHRDVLDALRQPLESGEVVIARSGAQAVFPARFTLVLAANPCPCANTAGPGKSGCSCSPAARRRYLARISGPLLDRVDVKVRLQPVSRRDMLYDRKFAESSATVARRVIAARERCTARLAGTPWRLNAEVPGTVLRRDFPPGPGALASLDRAMELGQIRTVLKRYDELMNSAALPAVVYKRKSRDPHNLASIEDQDRLGRADVDEQGWELAAVLDDAGRSASRFATKDRPAWETLLGMVRDSSARVVVLWESNRGDRKLTEWSGFLDLCRETGTLIRVVSHDQTYDVRKHRDWKTLAEDGVSNAYFSDQLSAVVRRGQAGAAMRGEPPGPCPYGYRPVYSPETGRRTGWETVPEAAEHVRHIVTWIGSHRPVLTLRKDLHERGVKSPSGKDWWDQAYLRDIARNPAYAALRKIPGGELVDGKWPPIITAQQHADACAALETRADMARPGKQKHLLSHLARCGECGEPFVVYRREERLYYRCRESCFSIRYEWLDEVVSGVIVGRLAQPDAADVYRVDDARTAAVAGELAILRARLDSFIEQAADGHVSAAALAKIEAKLSPEIAAKERSLDALAVPPALRQVLGADDVAVAWAGMPVQAKRAVISALLTSITARKPPRRWRWMVLPEPADFGELVTFAWRH